VRRISTRRACHEDRRASSTPGLREVGAHHDDAAGLHGVRRLKLPNTGDIGLDTVGLEPRSWLEVDDTCMVRALEDGWLYALGDVNHHALLTHQGK
jgi:pyruvate/2-oxoglutarate dehydrogenase complex dihydrolipoamide dehydrogenase (E3) component